VVGAGAIIGAYASGWLIDSFFTHDGAKDWRGIMLAFAAYSGIVALLFLVLFRHPHDPKEFTGFHH